MVRTGRFHPGFQFLSTFEPWLDFGIGSDRLQVKNSALLTEALEVEPEKVQALFAEETVESALIWKLEHQQEI